MITNIDLSVLKFMAKIHNPVTDFIFSAITLLGDAGMVWIILAVILLIIPKHRKTGLALAVGLIVFHLICNTGLKNIIARPRPFVVLPELRNYIPKINIPSSYSMPSGHTMSSFVCATITAKNIKGSEKFAYPLAFLIALSRIYLLVHYPTDVIAGAVLGVVLGVGINKVKEKYL